MVSRTVDAMDDYADRPKLTIEIEEFDANPTIAAKQFDIWSLSIPHGTLIEELGANDRSYQLGKNSGPDVSLDEGVFRDLSRLLKSQPFAGSKP